MLVVVDVAFPVAVVELVDMEAVGGLVVEFIAVVGIMVVEAMVGGIEVAVPPTALGAILGASDGRYMLQSKLKDDDPKPTGHT
jgi:hypothetical protein